MSVDIEKVKAALERYDAPSEFYELQGKQALDAMAPDLARALVECVEVLRWMVDHVAGEHFARGEGDFEPADHAPAVDLARAALAKLGIKP